MPWGYYKGISGWFGGKSMKIFKNRRNDMNLIETSLYIDIIGNNRL